MQLLYDNMEKLRKTCLYKCEVDVSRTQQPFQTIKSEDLVPGDLILLKNNLKLPCDCQIVQGEALMNEMALNGESIPFRKTTDPKLKNLYCGTTVLVSQSN